MTDKKTPKHSSIDLDDWKYQLQENKSVDMSYSKRDLGRFRCNFYLQRGTIGLAIRTLPLEIPDLEELGLPNSIDNFFINVNNFILILFYVRERLTQVSLRLHTKAIPLRYI